MIRTGYSFKTAYGHLSDVISRIKEIGWTVAPIADRSGTYAFNSWTKAARGAGLRPVYGAELAVVLEKGQPLNRRTADFWIFLAKKQIIDLSNIIGTATNDEKSKDAELTYQEAQSAPGLVKIIGPWAQLDLVKPKMPDLYFGISPATPVGLYRAAKKKGLQLCATMDNLYPRREDKEIYRMALGRRANTQTYPQWIVSDHEWSESIPWLDPKDRKLALANRNTVLKDCVATLDKAEIFSPEKKLTLLQMCEAGAKRKGVNLKDKMYGDRLQRELKLIAEKKFESYFYIIADIIAWSKKKMIIGPARGSSCGSLVCYLLDITTVDPLKFGLLFERFIDITRADLPDIDIDLSEVHREEAFEYVEQKYGRAHVARLGTVGTLQPKSILNIAGAALKIPPWRLDKVADTRIVRSSGDSRASQQLEDTLKETEAGTALLEEYPALSKITILEDHPNNAGQHAAGICITKKPIANYVAVDHRTWATQCNKEDAEDLNMLKIDMLGLTQLSTFERTLELVGKPPLTDTLNAIPLNDEKAFAVLNDKKYSGIFQFNGKALQSLAKQINIESLNDIVVLTALARPGPLASGGANDWVSRRMKKAQITYIHPAFEPYLKDTLGVVIYQEQVMMITREIGALPWESVSTLRKAMSKSLGAEWFDSHGGNEWKANAIRKGIPKEVADKAWNNMCQFGSWAFNKCLSGNTKIKISKAGGNLPGEIKIKDLYEMYESNPSPWIKSNNRKPILVSFFPDKRGWPQMAKCIIKSGKKQCYLYSFDDGSKVECTPDHLFLINDRWQRIGDAKIGDWFTSVIYEKLPGSNVNGRGQNHIRGKRYKNAQCGFPFGENNPGWINGVTRYKNEFVEKMKGKSCKDCGETKERMEAHHNDFNNGWDRPKDLDWLCVNCHKKRHYKNGRRSQWGKGMIPTAKKLTGKVDVGMKETYDIEMPKHHNFVLQNGLVTHNSHAVAYGLMSYYSAYLKAHYPVEFAAATLDHETLPLKQIAVLRELAKEGISYKSVDRRMSTDRWSIDNEGNLIGPLTNIFGIGKESVKAILKSRETGRPLTAGLLTKLNKGKTSIDSLFPIRDAINHVAPNLEALEIYTPPTDIIDIQPGASDKPYVITGLLTRVAPRDENDAAKVAHRGYALKGPNWALNMFIRDDSDEIFAKINRHDYTKLSKLVLEKGTSGKSLFALKGTCPSDFRMISVKGVKYLGEAKGINQRDIENTRAEKTKLPHASSLFEEKM